MADVADAVDLANTVDTDVAGMLDTVGMQELGRVGRARTQTCWTRMDLDVLDTADLVGHGHGGLGGPWTRQSSPGEPGDMGKVHR